MHLPAATPATPRSAPARAAGFTLVELVVTISLAAILMAIGVPMYRESIGSSRLTGQGIDLAGAINLARSQAITLNQQVSFCRAASEAATACSGSTGDWEFWLIRTASGTVIRRGAIPTFGGAIRVRSDLTNDQLNFTSDGLASTNGALIATDRSITICSKHAAKSNRKRINLNRGSRLSTTTEDQALPCPAST